MRYTGTKKKFVIIVITIVCIKIKGYTGSKKEIYRKDNNSGLYKDKWDVRGKKKS